MSDLEKEFPLHPMKEFTGNRHLKLGGRRFIVKFRRGQAMSVRERVLENEGEPWEAFAEKSRWHHSKPLGGPNTLYRRVIRMVRKRDGILNNGKDD
ncbi:MAG: hypothetical protein CMP20_04155 [Rickettsiales bacterium]|nr:hypothetical protein [Rickettsiales bacterium]